MYLHPLRCTYMPLFMVGLGSRFRCLGSMMGGGADYIVG